MDRVNEGRRMEAGAAAWLETQGIRILHRNFRSHAGEVDLVGYDGDCLVFFEVKYRTDGACGPPEAAVTPAKQRRICRVSDFYRIRYGIPAGQQIRYDVVAAFLLPDRPDGIGIRWIRDAFPYHTAASAGDL